MQSYYLYQMRRRKCMKNDEIDKYIRETISRVENTLLVKAKEYVRNDDRLHNFNVGSALTGMTRERVLDGFMLKHYISYRDMLNDIDNGKLPSNQYVEEKIGDMIVYLILMEASIKNKNKKG